MVFWYAKEGAYGCRKLSCCFFCPIDGRLAAGEVGRRSDAYWPVGAAGGGGGRRLPLASKMRPGKF